MARSDKPFMLSHGTIRPKSERRGVGSIIQFFLDRSRLNYTLFLFLLLLGFFAYAKMPKELFPPIILDKVLITGVYAGAGPDTLDKMAVSSIEDEVKNVSGVKKVESAVQAGTFFITLTLEEGSDTVVALSKVKDAISLVRPDLPADMDEPTATLQEQQIPLILINIAANDKTDGELVEIAKEMKRDLSGMEALTNITIYGEEDREFRIFLDTGKMEAYGLEKGAVVSALSNLSYIFPLGIIEEEGGKHWFLSTFNGKKEAEGMLETLISAGGKKVYLKDIATIEKWYKESQVLSDYNGQRTISINVFKSEEGNAIELAERVRELTAVYDAKYPEVTMGTFSDTSIYIRNRLNTVVSNILFGLILVGLTMRLLINARISFVVVLGIPTSFVLSIIFLHYGGYSINMMSLLGALIAIGVIVDDAIIVAENIQRHIEEGMPPKQAALAGTKEVVPPVIAASLTTVFAFLPMLLLTGEMGIFVKIIPIAISALILSSLIESFIFLPIHSRHALSPKSRPLDWTKANEVYVKIIAALVHRRKTTLALFWIAVPALIAVGFATSKFQLFPKFDGSQLFVSGRMAPDSTLEETYAAMRKVEEEVLPRLKEFSIESVTALSGFQMDNQGNGVMGKHLFFFFIDLEKAAPDNIVEKYVTPYLSFDYDPEGRTRHDKSFVVEERLRTLLEGRAAEFGLEELEVKGQQAGVVNHAIEIKLMTDDDVLAKQAVDKLTAALEKIEGTKNVNDDARPGIGELKLEVTPYGERMGVSEGMVAAALNAFYLESERARSFDSQGVVEIVPQAAGKDRLETLKSFRITLEGGRQAILEEVVDFVKQPTPEKIAKEDGQRLRMVTADVDSDIVTAGEALEQIAPLLEEVRNAGIQVKLGGEDEQNHQLIVEMTQAFLVAMFLMFMTLLVMFNSFKYALLILSVIPLSVFGVFIGHTIMGLNLTMPSIIGVLGLAGVVINDGIIMLSFIRNTKTADELLARAKLRLRPIMLTSITTLAGLMTLIFFPSGQAKILQPLAVSLGFGLLWGTVLNLLYLPTLYALVTHTREKERP